MFKNGLSNEKHSIEQVGTVEQRSVKTAFILWLAAGFYVTFLTVFTGPITVIPALKVTFNTGFLANCHKNSSKC